MENRMVSVVLSTFLGLFIFPVFGNIFYDQHDSFADFLLRDALSRMGPEDVLKSFNEYGIPPNSAPPEDQASYKDYPSRAFEARRDAILNREPSIRDDEYLEHSSLFGQKFVQGGAGEGYQRLKPDGSIKNIQVVKTDSLPAYCNPPDPCPAGYTADDGCLEDFVNSADFSREYQASQECMCDSEHMFDCPGSTRENEIDALARTFENEGLPEAALDRLINTMQPRNPFLEGDKLPVVAKKTPNTSIK